MQGVCLPCSTLLFAQLTDADGHQAIGEASAGPGPHHDENDVAEAAALQHDQ